MTFRQLSGADCGSSTNIGTETIGFKTDGHVRVSVAVELDREWMRTVNYLFKDF
jgi:hypothetical protein